MSDQFLDPSVLATVNNFPLLARNVVEGFIAGLHKSLYHGFGSEFVQYRNYTKGDDLKYVDWKVYARQEKFQIKVFQEETNANCYIVLDCSASMAYTGTTSPVSKLQYAKMLAACLAYLVNRQGDNVGLTAYSNRLLCNVKPGHRSGQVNQICTELVKLVADGQSDTEALLRSLGEQFHRRGIIVIISDFIDLDDAALWQSIRRFRCAHHDCILFQVLDNDETTFPFDGMVRFIDSEDGSDIVTAPTFVRQRYLERFNHALTEFRNFCLEADIDYRQVTTVEPLASSLANYLHRRENFRR